MWRVVEPINYRNGRAISALARRHSKAVSRETRSRPQFSVGAILTSALEERAAESKLSAKMGFGLHG